MTQRLNQQPGFTLIEVLLVCGLIGILSAMALPGLLHAKDAAGASSAVGSLRAITSSQLGYAASCGGGFNAPDLTTLGVPPPGSNVPYISPDLSAANTLVKSSYLMQMTGTPSPVAPATCNGLAAGSASNGFKAGADPIAPSNSRFFGTNASMTIYEDTSSLYAGMPEQGVPPAGHPLE